ncbi:hypothetical protein D3C84_643780 [compost metagenome]
MMRAEGYCGVTRVGGKRVRGKAVERKAQLEPNTDSGNVGRQHILDRPEGTDADRQVLGERDTGCRVERQSNIAIVIAAHGAPFDIGCSLAFSSADNASHRGVPRYVNGPHVLIECHGRTPSAQPFACIERYGGEDRGCLATGQQSQQSSQAVHGRSHGVTPEWTVPVGGL